VLSVCISRINSRGGASIPAPPQQHEQWPTYAKDYSGMSDYEFTDVCLAPEGSGQNVFLGRWKPRNGNNYTAPPAVAAADGFVAVKIVDRRLDSVNPASVSKELNAHFAACSAEQKAGKRHFVKLIDAFARQSELINFKVFMVQELCLGTLVDRWEQVDAFLPPSERELVYIAQATAQALRLMHSIPLLHGDVRPSNVLFGIDGAVLLGDFGYSVSRVAD
jgi:serine/threonine protein kinase